MKYVSKIISLSMVIGALLSPLQSNMAAASADRPAGAYIKAEVIAPPSPDISRGTTFMSGADRVRLWLRFVEGSGRMYYPGGDFIYGVPKDKVGEYKVGDIVYIVGDFDSSTSAGGRLSIVDYGLIRK